MEQTVTRTLPRLGHSVQVGMHSELVLPGTPEWYLNNLTGVVEWQPGMMVHVGMICFVRYFVERVWAPPKLNFYIATTAGFAGFHPHPGGVEPAHTEGSAADGGVVWRRILSGRTVVRFKNTDAAGTISINRGKTAVANTGIVLSALESYTEGLSGLVLPYEGPWYGISNVAIDHAGGGTGGCVLAVSEG